MNLRDVVTALTRTIPRLLPAALVGLTCLSQVAPAQQTLGSITGTVMDSSGAVVPKAAVKIRNVATNFTVSAETTDSGSFNSAVWKPFFLNVTS